MDCLVGIVLNGGLTQLWPDLGLVNQGADDRVRLGAVEVSAAATIVDDRISEVLSAGPEWMRQPEQWSDPWDHVAHEDAFAQGHLVGCLGCRWCFLG